MNSSRIFPTGHTNEGDSYPVYTFLFSEVLVADLIQPLVTPLLRSFQGTPPDRSHLLHHPPTRTLPLLKNLDMVQVAIVSTVRLPGGLRSVQVLESFVYFHLSKGFDHIFLFFDSVDDPSLPFANERYLYQSRYISDV